MRLPIKYIAILVIVSLTATFAYQAHWLVKMYRTNKAKSGMDILNAIRSADYLELMMRVDSISEAINKDGQYSSIVDNHGKIGFSASFGRTNKDVLKNSFKQTYMKKDTIYEEEKKFNPRNIGLPEGYKLTDGYHALEFLASQVQSGLHSVVDFNIPINLARFDSILNIRLREKGLGIRHYTRILKLKNDSTLASNLTADTDTARLNRFVYVYDAQEKYAFHIFTESTNHIIVEQMAGILATSLFILIVLGGSFWFLIHTILRQKTLDEIKSDFTNNITHELKTPIAVAYAANDALLNFNMAENEKQRTKYLRISQEQLRKLSGLTEQILSMSIERRETFQLKPEKVEVSPLIYSLIEQHKLKAGKPVRFEVEIRPENITVHVDRAHFGNIISNLIDNAVKYSIGEARIKITCHAANSKLEVCVEDKGMGIPPEKLKLVFDKFYRIPTGNRHDVKGYGLGLFYVKTMVEKMGGQVEVKSEPGAGSRFSFTICGKMTYQEKTANDE